MAGDLTDLFSLYFLITNGDPMTARPDNKPAIRLFLRDRLVKLGRQSEKKRSHLNESAVVKFHKYQNNSAHFAIPEFS